MVGAKLVGDELEAVVAQLRHLLGERAPAVEGEQDPLLGPERLAQQRRRAGEHGDERGFFGACGRSTGRASSSWTCSADRVVTPVGMGGTHAHAPDCQPRPPPPSSSDVTRRSFAWPHHATELPRRRDDRALLGGQFGWHTPVGVIVDDEEVLADIDLGDRHVPRSRTRSTSWGARCAC